MTAAWCVSAGWRGRALLRSVGEGRLNRTVSTLAADRTVRECIMMVFATCYSFEFILVVASVSASKIFLEMSTFNPWGSALNLHDGLLKTAWQVCCLSGFLPLWRVRQLCTRHVMVSTAGVRARLRKLKYCKVCHIERVLWVQGFLSTAAQHRTSFFVFWSRGLEEGQWSINQMGNWKNLKMGDR